MNKLFKMETSFEDKTTDFSSKKTIVYYETITHKNFQFNEAKEGVYNSADLYFFSKEIPISYQIYSEKNGYFGKVYYSSTKDTNNVRKRGKALTARTEKGLRAKREEEEYAKKGYDLIFTGHAHSGQIVLPFIGALYAPDQGFMPKYTSGRFVKDGTEMILSRGLGDSFFSWRINNTHEIVSVSLKSCGDCRP